MISFNYLLPAMTDADIGDIPKLSDVKDSTGALDFITLSTNSITIYPKLMT
jgi:hypothetical protein